MYSLVALLGMAMLVLAPTPALAQWDNGTGNQNWDDPNNWAPGAVPSGSNAIVNLAGSDAAVISGTPSFTPVDIFVGQGSGNVGQIDHTAGTTGTGGGNWGFIGDNGGTGTYNLADTSGSGGTNTGFATGSGNFSAGRLYVGIGGGSNGTLNVNTTGTLSTTNGGESFVVGTTGGSGGGTLNLDNGTIDVNGEAWIGRNTTGTLNMSGGTINSGEWFVVGRDGGAVGNLNMTGGTINTSLTSSGSFLVLGSFGGATGTANVSGGMIDSTAGAGAYIGEGGNGTFNLSSSAIFNTNNLRIGVNDGGVGLFSVAGSSATVSLDGDLTLGLNSSDTETTAVGTLDFVADASGISTITAMGDVNLSAGNGDFLSVDLTSMTPGSGLHSDILLVDGDTSQGEFDGLTQGALTAFDGSSNPYYIDYTTAGDIWLRTTPTLAEALTAEVNQSTREVIIRNTSSAPITFNYYLMESSGSALDPNSWNSLDAQNYDVGTGILAADFDLSGTVDGTDLAQWEGDYNLNSDSDADGDGLSTGLDLLAWQRQNGQSSSGLGWFAAGGSDPNELAELSLDGGSTLDPNEWVSIGMAYDPNAPGAGSDFLTFKYAVPGDSNLTSGNVVFVPGPLGALATVPEPSTLALLLAGLYGFRRRRA